MLIQSTPRSGRKVIDLTGQTFGRWYVAAYAGTVGQHRKYGIQPGSLEDIFLCRCQCGTERLVRSWALRLGRSKSCGCLQKEQATKRLDLYRPKGKQTRAVQ